MVVVLPGQFLIFEEFEDDLQEELEVRHAVVLDADEQEIFRARGVVEDLFDEEDAVGDAVGVAHEFGEDLDGGYVLGGGRAVEQLSEFDVGGEAVLEKLKSEVALAVGGQVKQFAQGGGYRRQGSCA